MNLFNLTKKAVKTAISAIKGKSYTNLLHKTNNILDDLKALENNMERLGNDMDELLNDSEACVTPYTPTNIIEFRKIKEA